MYEFVSVLLWHYDQWEATKGLDALSWERYLGSNGGLTHGPQGDAHDFWDDIPRGIG